MYNQAENPAVTHSGRKAELEGCRAKEMILNPGKTGALQPKGNRATTMVGGNIA